jgi:hypothetical protein
MGTGDSGLLRNRNGGDMGQFKTGSSNRNLPADDTVLKALDEQIRRWPRTDALVSSSSLGGLLGASGTPGASAMLLAHG